MSKHLFRLTSVGAAIALMLVSAAVPSAAAETTQHRQQHNVVVRGDGPAQTWQGTVKRTAPTREVPECQANGCDKVTVKVNLSKAVTARYGGVQFAIQWSGVFDDNLGLYVYRHLGRTYRPGELPVAKADAIVATTQSLLVPLNQDVNGTYTVYVANRTPDLPGVSPSIRYTGLAEVEYDPARHPRRLLLPDLVAIAPPTGGVRIENPGSIFGDTAPAGSSCFQESEIDEQGARVCLRFDNVSANIGEGPVDLRFDRLAGAPRQNEPVKQRLMFSSGNPGDYEEREIGEVEFHPVHDHYHFVGYSLTHLHAIKLDGSVGEVVRSGRKVSFCMADTAMYDFTGKGDGPQGYPAPDCLEPKETVDGVEYFSQGMSRGRADKYDWFLPAQMVEVSGLLDGEYYMKTAIDPDNLLQEVNDSNNCIIVRVKLSNMGTNTPKGELVGVGPACTS